MSKLILPKVYENEGNKYPQHKGKYKLSYSQYSSWIDPEYRNDYIVQYFLGIRLPDGIWAKYGGEVGTYIECKANKTEFPVFEMLSEEDKGFLDSLDYPPNCLYEDEICVDMESFVTQGFTDRTELLAPQSLGIKDYKTGNLDKKASYYADEAYGQTTLYAYQKQQEGFEITYSRVCLLGRKGNNMTIKGVYYPIKLSGEYKIIDTPYSEERAQAVLDKMRIAAEEISDLYKVYLKFFT